MSEKKHAATLGELKKSGYQSKSVKDEIRTNLILKLQKGETVFDGILGYEDTVLPQVERAILAGHNINFLGLRGQAKTRMARKMVGLLDEYMPIVAGSEINDDPLNPLSRKSRELIQQLGDKTPIEWVHRDSRYTEKLATPDVNIADLIGDIDPIKAANLKLSFSDEEVIHFGLIPRSNRGIFVINELPDLQPRIQVSLFNILQEGDIQIRGFKLRFPLDVQFLFTANPEDYTNRGAIITPLKDRIQSQIFTHYPQTAEIGMEITRQEAKISETQKKIKVPHLIERLVEQIAQEARVSEFVDEKSGVSARLSISALESVISAVERRMLINKEKTGTARISDLNAAVPAIVGKIEMVYEGEQEGAASVAHKLIGAAIRTLASDYFPGIENVQKKSAVNAKEKFAPVIAFFEDGYNVDLVHDLSAKAYEKELKSITGLKETVESLTIAEDEGITLLSEFLLHALAEYSLLDRKIGVKGYKFQDYFSSIIRGI